MNEELQKLGIESEQDLYEVLTESEEADTLFSDIYGYITEECSMEDKSFPGMINLEEYKGLYIVWIDDECPSFNGTPYFWKYEVFTMYEDAKQYFDSMKGKGIKPINERIKECIRQTSDSKRIEIVMRSQPYCNMFDVYYKSNLLIEHMGYQESYVGTRNKEDFAALTEFIRSIGKDFYNEYGTLPVEIITEKDGQKWIYFVGERYLQSEKERILGYVEEDEPYNTEERKLATQDWLEKIILVFTENKNAEGIWQDSGQPVTAMHEKFIFNVSEEERENV